jgi:hypothetical protein
MRRRSVDMANRKNTPQLPCGTNYGAYPKFTIRAGTRVRIQRQPGGEWHWHKTRLDLTFASSRHSTEHYLWFDYESWRILVPRRFVVGA